MAMDILHSVFVIIILIESNPDFEMRKKTVIHKGFQVAKFGVRKREMIKER